ncbi:MAG: U32 family peptidase [Lachnospiraceae bacterium]|nr:U32 family peptidase [Lachnospiraceae bacterium]
MRKTELLAPAGSLESLKAAVNAGADAVYIGGTRFGARAYADNLTEEDMKWAIDYAHLHGVSLYMTINTLLKERELEEELYDYVKPYYEQGLDAVIVQDFGVLKALSEWFPDLPLHVSTQMTVAGAEGFEFLKDFPNVTRIVTSRELSLEELRHIRNTTDFEIESFIHGALCYCYSGQCLFSSVIGGRSGNRGRCAQPCRLPYDVLEDGKCISGKNEKYILSPKDMNTLELLPKLLDMGIDSLKIEGRMKRPEYTAGGVSIYRKYIDRYMESNGGNIQIQKKDIQDLEELFRKRGYSQGFYVQHNGRNMMALSAPENEKEESMRSIFMDSLYEKYVRTQKQEKIKGILEVSTENPMKLLLQWDQLEVEVIGQNVMLPKNHAMTAEDFEKQLRKTGNTPFEFESLKVNVQGDVFVPNGAINELRRNALQKLEEAVTGKYRRVAGERPSKSEVPKSEAAEPWKPVFHVSVETKEQLDVVLASDVPESIYIDSSFMSMAGMAALCETTKGQNALVKKQLFYILPPVFRMETAKAYTEEYCSLKDVPWTGFMVKNLEGYQWLEKMGNKKPVILDANLYTFNSRAKNFWKEQENVLFETLPVELNFKELKQRGCEGAELIVYGHLPMMTSAGCVYKSLKHCRKGDKRPFSPEDYYQLKDRKNMKFAVKPVCKECYNIIYNSQPLSLLNLRDQIASLRPGSVRLSFTLENGTQTRKVLESFEKNYCKNVSVEDFADFTRGHFKRGVE